MSGVYSLVKAAGAVERKMDTVSNNLANTINIHCKYIIMSNKSKMMPLIVRITVIVTGKFSCSRNCQSCNISISFRFR